MSLAFPFKEKYYKNVEKVINQYFQDTILLPMQKELKEFFKHSKIKLNSKDILAEAFASNKIIYQDGLIIGNFNSKISSELRKLGAKYSKKQKGFLIPKNRLGANSLIAISGADDKFKQITSNIIKNLADIDIQSSLRQYNLFEAYSDSFNEMDNDFRKKAKSIEIKAELTEEQKKIIAEQWTNNLELYIKNFTQENILRLREKVEKNVYTGKRAENLVKIFQDEFEVTKNKAKFLARQETSLLTSKFREERYKSLRLNEYIWRGAMDVKERPDHKALEGKKFSWDNPPVVDKVTGRTGHPGEDYGCRCLAIPVV